MNRRQFIAWSGAAVIGRHLGALPRGDEVEFYVAGVRFHGGIRSLRRREEVSICEEEVGPRHSFVVESSAGERIGYVPRGLVPWFEERTSWRACVVEARPYAVPWKKVRVRASSDA